MKKWAYRAKSTRADGSDTFHLLMKHRYLWRSLHNERGAKISNVQHVQPGHLIFVYYRYKKRPLKYVGAFKVQDPGAGAVPATVGCPAGFIVKPGTLLEKAIDACLKDDGTEAYERDPKLDVYTGFRVAPAKHKQPTTPDFSHNALLRL